MSWIEFHATLPTHAKLYALADLLKIERAQAMGHIAALWLWAIDNAESGDLSEFTDRAIADVALWRKKPAVLVGALRETRWLNEDGTLHNWDKYAGRLVRKRAANAARMKDARALHVQVLPDKTVPDRTEPQTSPRARKARDFYEAVTKRKPENAVMEQVLDDIDFAHGEKCVAWAFEAAAGKEQPWPYTKRILDKCILEGHGPRSSNGARADHLRPQNSRNHRGKPEESGDWVQAIIAEQRRTDAALGRPDRNAPGDAAAVLEQDV